MFCSMPEFHYLCNINNKLMAMNSNHYTQKRMEVGSILPPPINKY